MGVHILLADPRNLIGKDLRELLGTFPIVEHIDEVATDEELKVHLSSCPIDLAIVHQSFMSNMDELSKKYFLIVATQGDTDIALTVLDQGGRAYDLVQDMETMLSGVVRVTQEQGESIFLINPVLAFNTFSSQRNTNHPTVDLSTLTPREYEVLTLLQNDLTDEQIARRLCTTEGTVRSHLFHIEHKLGLNRKQLKRLPLPKRIDDNES